MKILHIIPSVAQVRGGPSQAVLAMVRSLIANGIEAEIATTNDDGANLLDVPLNQKVSYENVPVYFFSRFSPSIHTLREFAFSRSFTSWLWQQVNHYDLLHVHAIFSYPSTAAMTIARHQRVPYLVRPLGQLCQWSLQQSERKKQIYLKLIERKNLNYSKSLHLTTLQEQQEINQLHLTVPSFILPHGLTVPSTISNARDRLRQRLNLPLDEPIVLFLSRIHPKKGLGFLIPALGRLRHHRFTFVVAGSGLPEHEREVAELIAKNGLSDRTYHSGFVSGEWKDLLLQGADLFTLTSHSENFGIAVLEAMAAGLPVVTTPGVALASVIKDYQLGEVSALEVNDIAAAVDQCLSNLQQMKEKGDRARQLVLEQYSWNQISQKLIKIYNQILNQEFIQKENIST